MNRTAGKILRALALLPVLIVSAAEFKFPGQTITVPDGFEVELAAGPELAPRPIYGSFDELGRLYVVDSSGASGKSDEQKIDPQHRVLRLEDTDNDGKFDKQVVFADKMMFPEGCLWYDGSVYVAAPPNIWKLTDTNSDAIADVREIWHDGKTLTGCANDLHGPYLGPDGWIYWTKGAFAEQTYEVNGKPWTSRAAHIFRARPDHSRLEPVITGGMDNPVGLAWTPEGELIMCGTFFVIGEPGKRDGLIHAVYGGVYGKQNAVLEGHKRTGDLMPIMTHMGAAAPASVRRYESAVFGEEYRDNMFCAQFNMHKVSRHILVPDGATFKTKDSDFLVSDNPDFHPTDIVEDADGSLLILDTGAWYKICCPTSQLSKPDVLGAIYRVRRKGAKVDAKALAEARAKMRAFVDGRIVEARKIALERNVSKAAEIRARIEGNVGGPSHLVRVSAEALGRIGDRKSIPHLLGLASLAAHDRVFEHSLAYALIEINDGQKTRIGLTNRGSQRLALIALDQMDSGDLKPDEVAPLLKSPDAETRKAAMWVAGHHPEWGEALAGFFGERIAAKDLTDADRAELEKQLAQFASNDAIQQVIVESLKNSSALATRQMLLRVMAQPGLKEAPKGWSDAVRTMLDEKDDALVRAAIATARSLSLVKTNPPNFAERLQRIARDKARPDDLRLDALAALPRGLRSVEPDLFEFLRANVDPAKSVAMRSAAAGVLAKAKLSDEQLLTLADTLKTTGPMEVARVLPAFNQKTNEAVGLRLITVLKESKGLSGVRPDALRSVATNYPATVQTKAEELLASLNQDAAKQAAHLTELLASWPQGDIRRGQLVFNSTKAACSSCHKIGYAGGNVGPDLTSIGQARTERDLLESILYPNASFVRSYEPLIVVTKNDEDHSGVLRKDGAEEIVLATGPNTEVHVARKDITEMRPGAVSVMPGGLDQLLTKQELVDLVTFLKNTKWGAN